jgi:hypothetical protein
MALKQMQLDYIFVSTYRTVRRCYQHLLMSFFLTYLEVNVGSNFDAVVDNLL